MSRAGAERGHPDVDRLADLDAGLLDAAADGELRAHLTGCTACRGVMEALAETRAALAELPDEPMPAHVAARLDQAIAAESAQRESADPDVVTRLPRRADGERAAPRSSPHSSQRPRAWLPRAAAAAVVVLAGAGVAVAGAMGALPGSHGGGAGGGAAGTNAESAASPPRVIASGRDYTPTTLRSDVRALLNQSGPSAYAIPRGHSGQQLPQGGSVGPIRPSSAAPPILDSAGKQRACLATLSRSHAGRPLLLDRATYEGKPAAVVVFAGSKPATVVVDVVGPRCGAAGPDLLVQRTVPR